MLSLSNINVSYDGSRILRGVNLTIPERSLVCLMGRNGVGKTTTLKTIVGLVKPDGGSVNLAGTELAGLPPDQRARLGIGYVPQGRDIFPHLTVWENLKISLVVHGTKANGQVERVLDDSRAPFYLWFSGGTLNACANALDRHVAALLRCRRCPKMLKPVVSGGPVLSRVLLVGQDKTTDKHACKGKNDCKGKGGCKAGDNGCKGKNSCKGKGGCATDGSKQPKAA